MTVIIVGNRPDGVQILDDSFCPIERHISFSLVIDKIVAQTGRKKTEFKTRVEVLMNSLIITVTTAPSPR